MAKRDELGDSRFRLQGTVMDGTINETGDGVDFTVTFNGAEVAVHHRGDPPELFKAGEPVVLEGRWDRTVEVFDSDRMLVKHDERYDAVNQDRIKEAEQGGSVPAPAGSMNVFLGSTGVLLGLSAAVLGSITLIYTLVKKRTDLQWLTVPYTGLIVLGAVLAVFAIDSTLITRDFTVKFVADNGSSRTPALYNVATLWAALEGSIILWALILSGYTAVVVAKFRRRLSDPLVGWAVLTMFVVAAFFFFLMAFPANPFKSFHPPPGFDGPGPNPLLQNHPLMAFHPPMLYLGYVGFTVPFAFAIAALATGRVGEGWFAGAGPRRWTLFAWGFLTVGIVLGAWWSYEVLGWGGSGPGIRSRTRRSCRDHRYRIPTFGDGARATGDAPRLEPVVVVRHVLVDHPRHVHHSFGRARFGPCVHRERHRSVDSRVLHRDGRGHDRVDCVAR